MICSDTLVLSWVTSVGKGTCSNMRFESKMSWGGNELELKVDGNGDGWLRGEP